MGFVLTDATICVQSLPSPLSFFQLDLSRRRMRKKARLRARSSSPFLLFQAAFDEVMGEIERRGCSTFECLPLYQLRAELQRDVGE